MKKIVLTKSELIAQMAQRYNLPKKKASILVNAVFEKIIQAVANGDKYEMRGFGSFTNRERNSRQSRNPKTGETVQVPAKRVPFFKTGQDLKIVSRKN